MPDVTHLPGLNLWASIAFAFAGLELSSAMGGEVRNPRRTLPRAVLISAPLIALIYILGTGALLRLVPTSDINIVSGFLQAITVGAKSISPSLWWLAPLCAAAYTIGNIGGVGAWLTGPARVAFAIGLDRYFPPAFGRVHPIHLVSDSSADYGPAGDCASTGRSDRRVGRRRKRSAHDAVRDGRGDGAASRWLAGTVCRESGWWGARDDKEFVSCAAFKVPERLTSFAPPRPSPSLPPGASAHGTECHP